MASKRKVTVTLDDGLVATLERHGALSTQLNEAGWEVVRRLAQSEDLARFLDELDSTDGPLPDDPTEDSRIGRLLGGT